MSSATRIRADVLALMKREGRELTIRRNTGGAYDPSIGTVPASTDDTEFTGWGRVGTYSDYLANGEQIRRGDRKVTFVPDDLTFAALAGDVVVVTEGSEEYTVIQGQRRELGGETISWTMQVRNG